MPEPGCRKTAGRAPDAPSFRAFLSFIISRTYLPVQLIAMIYLVIFVFCIVAALGTGILAGLSDFRGLVIPNMYPAIVAGTAVPAVAAAHFAGVPVMGPPLMHGLIGAAVFAATFVLFTIKAFGGGDSKLLTAYALLVGPKGIVPLLFYMALSGAVLGVFTIYTMKKKPFKAPKEGGWIARVQAGENRVPYGIPIVLGAVAAFAYMGCFSPSLLGAFAGQ